MLTVHKNALEGAQALYHEFLMQFSHTKACIWGFVEGRTDPSFYVGKAESMLPDSFEVDFWPAGNKKRVVDLYKLFDWSRFDKKQVLFFIDRDLSDYVPDHRLNAPNVYTTDNYSIENDLVANSVCKRILTEIMGLHELRGQEMDKVLSVFKAELLKFYRNLLPIMAYIVAWRRRGDRPCVENIKMKDLFCVQRGRLHRRSKPKGCRTVTDYLCKKLGLKRQKLRKLCAQAKRDLISSTQPKRFIRGKYELWFLVAFCESVRNAAPSFCHSLKAPPKSSVNLGTNNALCIVGTRARAPNSLKHFFRNTCCAYAGVVFHNSA